jgi:endonuclease-3
MKVINRSLHPHLDPASSGKVVRALAKRYTKKGDMDLGNPKDTLIGVILSARTKDTQVLKVFPGFKKAFPTFESLARSSSTRIAKHISNIGLYRSKAKAIHGLSNIVTKKYRGRVPSTMDGLLELPGVGRKTANCVLSYVFGQDTVCVDTHVFRIAHRLGWTRGKNPERVEQDLQKVVPKKLWREINRTFVQFGRDICRPGTPQCWRCPVAKWCAFRPKTERPKTG